MEAPSSPSCTQIFKELKNPYYLGDEVGLTRSLGWVDAWTSSPSVYAVAAETTNDVVAAVNFGRENNLRLVVKGGGHSYQGTSNAADSLLIWTRRMNSYHFTRFVCWFGMCWAIHAAAGGNGRAGRDLGAGLRRCHDKGRPLRSGWRMYDGWRCGLDPERGFRQLFESLRDGCREPAGSRDRHCRWRSPNRQRLHESRPVLGDQGGRWRQSWCRHPAHVADHGLPELFGAVNMTIKATSQGAFRQLIGKVVEFYSESDQSALGRADRFSSGQCPAIEMVFQGFDHIRRRRCGDRSWSGCHSSQDFNVVSPLRIVRTARHSWDPEF